MGCEPWNELNTAYLASLCFPVLFPDTNGDPKSCYLLRYILKSETESFAEKNKHLIRISEKQMIWVYRFTFPSRFGFWAYNILYLRCLLGHGNYF